MAGGMGTRPRSTVGDPMTLGNMRGRLADRRSPRAGGRRLLGDTGHRLHSPAHNRARGGAGRGDQASGLFMQHKARCAIKTQRVADGVHRLAGAWRGPIGIKPGRIYPRSPPDQPRICLQLKSLRGGWQRRLPVLVAGGVFGCTCITRGECMMPATGEMSRMKSKLESDNWQDSPRAEELGWISQR
jgi:hypothetical protein